MDRSKIILIVLLLPLCGQSQTHIISGFVSDLETKQAVPFAHVFFSNTTIGTVSDEHGRFELEDSPDGPRQLIVSYLGYESYSFTLPSTRKDLSLQIKLRPKQEALDDVTV